MNINKLQLGTVSHGTLRPEDLAVAFLSTAQHLEVDLPDGIENDVEAIVNGVFEHDAAEVLIEIGDRIDDALPSFLRFGTHEGDSSDWGIWGDERFSEELVEALLEVEKAREGDSNEGEILSLQMALDLALEQLRD